MPFVRKSKLRHVFGSETKKDQWYEHIRISGISWESRYCDVNTKFLAIMTAAADGAAFLVLPLSKTGRVPSEQPLVSGHRGAVLDLAWCPHNDNVIASASDDCTVKIWEIPDEGISDTNIVNPICTLEGHIKRVTSVVWHPTAENVLFSVGSDNKICIWYCGGKEGVLLNEISVPEQVYSLSFNYDGSKFVTTCKDKQLRIFDSATGEKLEEKNGHEGSKPAQCVFLKDGRIFTSGFSKSSVRQYALWDSKLDNILCEEIDNNNSRIFIFYDPDLSIVYLYGKGDSQIRYYEVDNEQPYVHWINNFISKTPQKGIGFLPKRGCNTKVNEIARFYKLTNSGICEVIPFKVPRKSEQFQDDLYPDTASDEATITVDDFKAGRFKEPKLVSFKEVGTSTKKEFKGGLVSHIKDRKQNTPTEGQSNNAATHDTNVVKENSFDLKELMDEVKSLNEKVAEQSTRHKEELKELREIFKVQDDRIKDLEAKLVSMENMMAEESDDNEEIDCGVKPIFSSMD